MPVNGRSTRIGVGDQLKVSIWEASGDGLFSTVDKKQTDIQFVVDATGLIFIPYVGRVRAEGETVESLRSNIQDGLKGKAVQPQVQITVTGEISNSVVVVGDISRPGLYPLSARGAKLLEMIAVAGGAREATYDTVATLKRATTGGTVRLEDLIDHPENDIWLAPGDTVLLSHKPRTFAAFGAIQNTQLVPFKTRSVTLTDALAQVGGLRDMTADAGGVFLFRYEAGELAQKLRPGLPANLAGNMVPMIYRLDMTRPESFFLARSFQMKDQDIIYVANHPVAEFGKFLQIISPLLTSYQQSQYLSNEDDSRQLARHVSRAASETFLRAEVRRMGRSAGACDMVAGWGGKPSGLRARKAAQIAGVPCLLVEDGFLRSVERDGPPLSLVADDIGIYHDATRASRLEALIAAPSSSAEQMRARALIGAWKAARVSKYNHARDYEGNLPQSYVLVVDQTQGDASVGGGLADAKSFERMLAAALSENPDRTIVVKCHPDVFTRRKLGYFDPRELACGQRVRVIASDCHAARLVEQADAVYTVTSQVGFEALLYGKRTRTFGMPFYAGWGLTHDELPAPSRRATVSLEQLVHAALVGIRAISILKPMSRARSSAFLPISHSSGRCARDFRQKFMRAASRC